MYNVEIYVERCIRSLENQNISPNEYEIICINDGSPDNSRGVVEMLQEEYSNIILINQENKGVSRARNTGIDIAVGKYLLFIDPDDYIIPNVFENALKFADLNRAQVVFLGYTVLNINGRIHKNLFNEELKNQLFTGPEAYFFSRGDGLTDPDRMVAVLFRRDLLNNNNLRYLPDVPFLEDGEFIARILCLAERCVFWDRPFYRRTTRLGSATRSRLFNTEYARNGFLLAACNLKKFQKGEKLTSIQYHFLNQPICKFVLLFVSPASDPLIFFKIRRTKNKLIENGLYKLDLTSVDKEFRAYGSLYNQSLGLYLANQYLTLMFRSVKNRFNRLKLLLSNCRI